VSLSEPAAWTKAREQRMQSTYPQLQVASPGDVMSVDAFKVAQGQAPTSFSKAVLDLANFAAQQQGGSSPDPAAAAQPAGLDLTGKPTKGY
jgi:hypothetical protein